jgi:hypothetical protein
MKKALWLIVLSVTLLAAGCSAGTNQQSSPLEDGVYEDTSVNTDYSTDYYDDTSDTSTYSENADKDDLEFEIEDGATNYKKNYIGAKKKNIKIYKEAFANAQAVYDNSDASQSEVDDALEQLEEAVELVESTINFPSITKKEFKKIKNGMTLKQVKKIVGGSGEVVSESSFAGYKTVMREFRGSDGANANIMLQNGRVVSKAQFGL